MRSLSIRAKLVLASVATVVVAMVVLTAANILTARDIMKTSIRAQAKTMTDGSVREVESWVRRESTVVAALKPVALSDHRADDVRLAQRAGDFNLSYIATSDGQQSLSKDVDLPPDFDPRTRDWYKAAVAAGDTVLTPPYMDVVSNQLVVSIVMPFKRHGDIRGVVGSDIFLTDVVKAVNALRPTEHSFAYLVGGNGKIIAHPDDDLTLQPATDVFAAEDVDKLRQSAQQPDVLQQATRDGTDYWLSVRPIAGTNWLLVVALDKNDVLAGVYHMRTQAIVTGIVMIVLAGLVLFLLTRALLRRLGVLRDALQDIASGEGDLTRRLDASGHDELAEVGAAFNEFVDKIAHTLSDIRETTESVDLASDEIAQGNADLSSRTESNAASLEQTSSSMEEIASTVKQTADSSNTAVALVDSARDAAREGSGLMERVETNMRGINDNSEQIGAIVATMDGIASQTNILALNAAVEAARAGEHGKGFAVVAKEVRALAQRSAESARDIRALVDTNVSRVADGGQLVTQAGSAMGKIDTEVQRVADIISEIRLACNEQSDGIGQIETAVQQLDGATQQNAALVQESSAAANSLSNQAQTLAQAVAGFKLDDEMAPAAQQALPPVAEFATTPDDGQPATT